VYDGVFHCFSIALQEKTSMTLNDELLKKKKRDILLIALKILLLIGVIAWDAQYPEGTFSNYLPKNLTAALSFWLTSNLFISFGRLTLTRVYIRRRKLEDSPDSFVLGIRQFSNVLSVLLLLFSLLILFNINIRELFTSLSIIAAAIAILSKDYISNMINGMIIMFSNQFTLNDYIRVGQHRGRIINITLINVQILNDQEDIIFIPNTTFFTTDVVNYTKKQINEVNIEFEIKLQQLKSTEALETYLSDLVKPYMTHIRAGSVNLRSLDVKSDLAVMNFQFEINNSDKVLEKEIRKVVLRGIVRYVN
jgi:small-conductance mechanosensitive channel